LNQFNCDFETFVKAHFKIRTVFCSCMAQLARRITLSAPNNIEIGWGVVLPAGTYAGIERQMGIELIDRTCWSEPEFKIEFTADQLASFGATGTANMLSVEYDVTQLVRLRQ
jgi:hypothetical protein